ncbi:MAG TPA: malate synthase A [Gaiellaceae bacterium]|nr:malate synthase A [Gaiellaceae bacterium]
MEVLAPADEEVLTREALEFVARLHRELNPRRLELLERRRERQAELDAGALPGFLPETKGIREGSWQVAPAPADLRDRRCEITAPVDRKMMINALNSGARVFMADYEDANSPTWTNVVEGQRNVSDAIRRTISLDTGEKRYRLNEETATLLIRPRGWHLPERHVQVDGEPVSASLFDFGVHMVRNAREQCERGSGPYFYLPKLESHHEARLWGQAFECAEEHLGLPHGTIRCTVLIETILAAFEMEEILHELRDWGCALNAGRWDYIFSAIKKFRSREDWVLPDRVQVTMTVPFMRGYTELLVRSCHRRGAHAIGGMAAFIPSRKDAEANELALAKVREDKEREAGDGFDGSWVAHPDLVPVCTEVFDRVLGERPNQLERLREEVVPGEAALLSIPDTPGEITEQGLRTNVSVGVRYLDAWLHGVGAAAIDNLMEDAATAEISRAQVWSWVRAGRFDEARVREEIERVEASDEAKEVFAEVALGDELGDFLTLRAYDRLP